MIICNMNVQSAMLLRQPITNIKIILRYWCFEMLFCVFWSDLQLLSGRLSASLGIPLKTQRFSFIFCCVFLCYPEPYLQLKTHWSTLVQTSLPLSCYLIGLLALKVVVGRTGSCWLCATYSGLHHVCTHHKHNTIPRPWRQAKFNHLKC